MFKDWNHDHTHTTMHGTCLAVYLAICVFDFVVVPSWIGITNEALMRSNDIDKALVEKVVLRDYWEPLTLQNGGLFHLAMGAIITGGVMTRKKTNKEESE